MLKLETNSICHQLCGEGRKRRRGRRRRRSGLGFEIKYCMGLRETRQIELEQRHRTELSDNIVMIVAVWTSRHSSALQCCQSVVGLIAFACHAMQCSHARRVIQNGGTGDPTAIICRPSSPRSVLKAPAHSKSDAVSCLSESLLPSALCRDRTDLRPIRRSDEGRKSNL